jgi:putative FmdB family regulatory protein
MPIYEYECKDCGNEFEKIMSFSAKDIDSPECPGCSSHETQRRISRVSSHGQSSSGGYSGSSCGSSGGFS